MPPADSGQQVPRTRRCEEATACRKFSEDAGTLAHNHTYVSQPLWAVLLQQHVGSMPASRRGAAAEGGTGLFLSMILERQEKWDGSLPGAQTFRVEVSNDFICNPGGTGDGRMVVIHSPWKGFDWGGCWEWGGQSSRISRTRRNQPSLITGMSNDWSCSSVSQTTV